MIKLIVSDLDGTLLPAGHKELDAEIISMIRQLKEKGILFAVASGRSYQELKRFFAPVSYDIIYICENGALIMYHEEIQYQKTIPYQSGIDCIREIKEHTEYEWLAAGLHTCYIASEKQEYLSYLSKNNLHPMHVRALRDIPEAFLRISVYHDHRKEEIQAEPFVKRWQETLHASYWGDTWLDFTRCGIHKGEALKAVKQRFLTPSDEVLAFGDQDNDKELLDTADYGYWVKEENEVKNYIKKNFLCGL
ncbi:MAG: HAD family hydrolase [Lachnospiraceae bacterium]